MYQWGPSDYGKNSSAQERAADAVIALLFLRGNEHILDNGCGDGKVTAKMAALVPLGRVTGVESSPDMICREEASLCSMSNAFHHIDAWRATNMDL